MRRIVSAEKVLGLATTSPIYIRRRWLAWLLIALFVMACVRFALVQDIWIDEATQLSGVRLSIPALVGWLSGTDAGRFGLPGDRMPPLAYLLDHLWWQAAGDSATRFRMFHILLVAAGVALVARAEIAAMGGRWLGIGLAFLVLSPKLINLAGELRSYSLFFAVTCVLMAMFLDIVKNAEHPLPWRKVLLFGGGCVVLCYIHFFGVVASFSFFATLLLAFCRKRSSFLRVLAAGAGVALCLAGLYPFIFGATSMSAAGAVATPADITLYLPLLLGHPSLMIFPVAASLYFGGCVLLLLAAAYGVARRALGRRMEPVDWLLVVAMTGCAATILPGFLIGTFSVLKPTYSIWLLPVLTLILSLGASQPIGLPMWDRYGRFGAAIALLLGAAAGTGIFLAKASWFVHGPHRIIETARELSPPPSAILYYGPTYPFGYFPMVYQSGGRLPQWLATTDGVLRLGGDGSAAVVPVSALARYRGLVVVAIRARHYTDLRDCLDDRCPDFDTPMVVSELVGSGHWTVASRERTFGIYDTVVTRLVAKAPM